MNKKYHTLLISPKREHRNSISLTWKEDILHIKDVNVLSINKNLLRILVPTEQINYIFDTFGEQFNIENIILHNKN